MRPIGVGDHVIKDGGDYKYQGTVVAKFQKKSGAVRFVVEHDDLGLLYIFNENQLRLLDS